MLEESSSKDLNFNLNWKRKLSKETIQGGFNFNTNWHAVVQKNLDPIFDKFSIKKSLKLVHLKDKAHVIFLKN